MKKMFKKKNKKAVSVIIGYILLIALMLVMAGVTYIYLKTYIPKDLLKCPEETSLFIKEKSCSNGVLNITIKNNGKFSVAGYYIYGSNISNAEIATIDLSNQLTSGIENQNTYFNSVIFEINTTNTLDPNTEILNSFTLNQSTYFIELIPARFERQGNNLRLISCGDSRAKEIVNCLII